MEFVLQTDLATALPASIEFNFDALEKELTQQLERYKNMVVTEDGIKEAKKDRAMLNTLRQAIDSKRKEVKKAYLAPFDAFEDRVKWLTKLVDAPIAAIDGQVKVYEEQQRTEKYAQIMKFYRINAKSLLDLVPLERILPEKWALKSSDLMNINQEIHRRLEKIRNDLGIIKAMRLPYEQQMVDTYLRTLDMSEAMAEKARLEKQEKAVEKVVPPEAPATSTGGAVGMTLVQGTAPASTAAQEVQCIDFRVFVTEEQKAMVRNFFIQNGIKYTKVPTDENGRVQEWQSITA